MFYSNDVSESVLTASENGVNRALFGQRSESSARDTLLSRYRELQDELRDVLKKLTTNNGAQKLLSTDILQQWRRNYGVHEVTTTSASITIHFNYLTIRYLSEYLSTQAGFPPIYIGLVPHHFSVIYNLSTQGITLKNTTGLRSSLCDEVEALTHSETLGHAHCSVGGPTMSIGNLCTGGNDFYNAYKNMRGVPDLSLAVHRTHKWLAQVNYYDCYRQTHLDFSLRQQNYEDAAELATANISLDEWKTLFRLSQTWLEHAVNAYSYTEFYDGESDDTTATRVSRLAVQDAVHNLQESPHNVRLPCEAFISLLATPYSNYELFKVWYISYSVLLLHLMSKCIVTTKHTQLASELLLPIGSHIDFCILEGDYADLPQLRNNTIDYVANFSRGNEDAAREVLI